MFFMVLILSSFSSVIICSSFLNFSTYQCNSSKFFESFSLFAIKDSFRFWFSSSSRFFCLQTNSSSSLRVSYTGFPSVNLRSFSEDSLKFFFIKFSISTNASNTLSMFDVQSPICSLLIEYVPAVSSPTSLQNSLEGTQPSYSLQSLIMLIASTTSKESYWYLIIRRV